jgi:hypothetical protein
VRLKLGAWDEPCRWRRRVRPRLHNPVPFAVIRTRPNYSTSWACARSAAGIHSSYVSSGRSRFGSGRSSSRRCTGGAASNYTCVITTSRADDRFVTFTKWNGTGPPEQPSVHENPESPPRLLERAKAVGDLEQDPYVSHRSKSRSSVDEPGVPEWPTYGP